MVYSLLLFVPRKPGLSISEFKQHWETTHVRLLKQIVGHDFPLSHTRHYIERTAEDEAHMSTFTGNIEGFGYDGVAILTFADKTHYGRFMDKILDEERAHREDLEKFVDISGLRSVIMGETLSTGRDGGMGGWMFVGSV